MGHRAKHCRVNWVPDRLAKAEARAIDQAMRRTDAEMKRLRD